MRTLLIVLLVVVAAVCGWMLFSPMRGEAGAVGVNTLVQNDVTTASAGLDAWKPAVIGADVFFGDRIATAVDSRLDIRLLDRSNLTVGANARLTIDRFIYDPSRNAGGALVSILAGAFRYASDEGRPEEVSFRTPGAAIGIRGTLIEGVVGPLAVALLAGVPGAPDLSADADSAAVIVLKSGAAEVRAGGQTAVLDQPVQVVILTRRGIYPPFALTPEITRGFEALLPPMAHAPVAPPEPADETSRQNEPSTPPAAASEGPKPGTAPPTRAPSREPDANPAGTRTVAQPQTDLRSGVRQPPVRNPSGAATAATGTAQPGVTQPDRLTASPTTPLRSGALTAQPSDGRATQPQPPLRQPPAPPQEA